jgi:hypothetical protein
VKHGAGQEPTSEERLGCVAAGPCGVHSGRSGQARCLPVRRRGEQAPPRPRRRAPAKQSPPLPFASRRHATTAASTSDITPGHAHVKDHEACWLVHIDHVAGGTAASSRLRLDAWPPAGWTRGPRVTSRGPPRSLRLRAGRSRTPRVKGRLRPEAPGGYGPARPRTSAAARLLVRAAPKVAKYKPAGGRQTGRPISTTTASERAARMRLTMSAAAG